MSVFPKILVDQAHSSAWSLSREVAARMNPANPADASLARAAEVLQGTGLQVVGHEQGSSPPTRSRAPTCWSSRTRPRRARSASSATCLRC
ncbi:hypothetical protein [Barrientosiimonas endolithica]|uniref:hypothetical protein n=1 Tax=Barrientosiimonas endolithica TaxID=1535208 RepID=UPI00259B6015|nr:hypothetical protein [Barrientosiimonas endolithica]